MSLQAMAWAWEQKLPASQKLTLLAIADIANEPNGFTYWAGLQRLADMQGCTYDQISRNIRDLIAGGYLERLTSGNNRKTKYRLCLDSTALSNQTEGDVAKLSNPDSTALSNPIPNSSINSTLNTSTSPQTAKPIDALVDYIGEPVNKGTWKFFQSIASMADSYEDVENRIRAHLLIFDFPLTPGSLKKRWVELGGPAAEMNQLTLKERRALKRQLEEPSDEEINANFERMKRGERL